MKFRLVSKNGDALGIAFRLAAEGYDVDFCIKEPKARPSYEGLLPQVESPAYKLTKDTILLFDMAGMGRLANQLRNEGYKVYGGSTIADKLELDREWAIKLAKLAGIKVPKYESFDSFNKARKFLSGKGGAWVFKPSGNKTTTWTYVSEATEDMLEMLDYFESVWKGKVDFILQERIYGVEVSTEVWYIDGEPIPNSLNSTFETKRFMVGDVGPNSGCMSSLVWFWKNKDAKIYRLTHKLFEPYVKRFKYSGPLDINCIVSEKDKLPYFLEFTSRFGYNAVYAFYEGVRDKTNFSELFNSLANGNMPKIEPSYNWLGAIRLSIPPYPTSKGAEQSADRPIIGITPDNLEHFWPLDAKFNEKEKFVSAGVDGVIGEVTGKSKTIEGLGQELYSLIDQLKIPDKQYRTDFVVNAKTRREKLKEWNYF